MLRKLSILLSFTALVFAAPLQAEPQQFSIDKGHTFVTFKVSHIGFAWIPGAFTAFDGTLVYDPDERSNSKVNFTVKVPSIDTWHAERDKHLQSEDFFAADEHPTATFVSTAYEQTGEKTAILRGNLTIKDITKAVEFQVKELAAREDPWGNFRRGFEATTELNLADFELDYAGPMPKSATVTVSLEATRAK